MSPVDPYHCVEIMRGKFLRHAFSVMYLEGFDPLKAEMESLRELGSSRESSMQRGASLDVSYDERDIFKVLFISSFYSKF